MELVIPHNRSPYVPNIQDQYKTWKVPSFIVLQEGATMWSSLPENKQKQVLSKQCI